MNLNRISALRCGFLVWEKALSMSSWRQELEQISHALKQKYWITVQLKRHLMSFYGSKLQQCECRCRVNVIFFAHYCIMVSGSWVCMTISSFAYHLYFILYNGRYSLMTFALLSIVYFSFIRSSVNPFCNHNTKCHSIIIIFPAE